MLPARRSKAPPDAQKKTKIQEKCSKRDAPKPLQMPKTFIFLDKNAPSATLRSLFRCQKRIFVSIKMARAQRSESPPDAKNIMFLDKNDAPKPLQMPKTIFFSRKQAKGRRPPRCRRAVTA